MSPPAAAVPRRGTEPRLQPCAALQPARGGPLERQVRAAHHTRGRPQFLTLGQGWCDRDARDSTECHRAQPTVRSGIPASLLCSQDECDGKRRHGGRSALLPLPLPLALLLLPPVAFVFLCRRAPPHTPTTRNPCISPALPSPLCSAVLDVVEFAAAQLPGPDKQVVVIGCAHLRCGLGRVPPGIPLHLPV